MFDLMTGRFDGEHLVIVRSSGSTVDFNSYNCQETGLAKALASMGLKTTVVMAGSSYMRRTLTTDGAGAEVITLPFVAPHQAIASFRRLNATLDSLRPTVVQIQDLAMRISGKVWRWARRNSVRCVLVQGAYELHRKLPQRLIELSLYTAFGKRLLRDVDAIGVKTPAAGRFLNTLTSCCVSVTPVGLDESLFSHGIASAKACSERKTASKDVNLLYVGALTQRRHPLMLIEMMKFLPDSHKLTIVGSGPLADKARQLAEAVGVARRVRFAGSVQQKDITDYYSSAHLCLLASDYEIYGMTMLEAMYHGTPVCSSLTAGSELLISPGIDGFTVEGFDPRHWAEVVAEATSNLADLETKGEAAAKKIRGHYLWKEAAKRYLDLYNL